MTWIRSPSWDCFWFLSAPVLGLLMLAPLAISLPTRIITAALVVVNFAHALAPIALAWSHDGFRAVMLERPAKFVGVPAVVVVAGVMAAIATSALFPTFEPRHMVLENLQLQNIGVPIVLWANLYAVWNLYHGGAQNFGFLCLYLRRGFRGRTRVIVLAICVAIVVLVGHEASRVFGWLPVTLFCMGLVTVNHWVAAIGLAAHVHARHRCCSPWWFISGALAAAALLVWLFYLGLAASLYLAVMALCLRGALGIWHFLADKWIWSFSKPEVRNTIGVDMFGHA